MLTSVEKYLSYFLPVDGCIAIMVSADAAVDFTVVVADVLLAGVQVVRVADVDLVEVDNFTVDLGMLECVVSSLTDTFSISGVILIRPFGMLD